jgi:hypothetical protein
MLGINFKFFFKRLFFSQFFFFENKFENYNIFIDNIINVKDAKVIL